MPKESLLVIREKPDQMMLSNPLESFLKDLGNQEPQLDPITQQPDLVIPTN